MRRRVLEGGYASRMAANGTSDRTGRDAYQ